MGQWISSKEFAKSLGITDRAVRKQAQTKKILKFNTKYFSYTYIKGVGGYAGKILQIWNTPLSQEQVEAIEKGYPVKYVLEEMGEAAQPNVMESKDSKTLDCKGNNNEKTSQNIQGETLQNCCTCQ